MQRFCAKKPCGRRKIKSRQQLQSTAHRRSSGTACCTFSEFLKIFSTSTWVLKTCRTKTLREKLSEQIAAAQESSRHQPFQSVFDKTASTGTNPRCNFQPKITDLTIKQPLLYFLARKPTLLLFLTFQNEKLLAKTQTHFSSSKYAGLHMH